MSDGAPQPERHPRPRARTVIRITEARFEALAIWCRNPASRGVLANCGFFSAVDERLIEDLS